MENNPGAYFNIGRGKQNQRAVVTSSYKRPPRAKNTSLQRRALDIKERELDSNKEKAKETKRAALLKKAAEASAETGFANQSLVQQSMVLRDSLDKTLNNTDEDGDGIEWQKEVFRKTLELEAFNKKYAPVDTEFTKALTADQNKKNVSETVQHYGDPDYAMSYKPVNWNDPDDVAAFNADLYNQVKVEDRVEPNDLLTEGANFQNKILNVLKNNGMVKYTEVFNDDGTVKEIRETVSPEGMELANEMYANNASLINMYNNTPESRYPTYKDFTSTFNLGERVKQKAYTSDKDKTATQIQTESNASLVKVKAQDIQKNIAGAVEALITTNNTGTGITRVERVGNILELYHSDKVKMKGTDTYESVERKDPVIIDLGGPDGGYSQITEILLKKYGLNKSDLSLVGDPPKVYETQFNNERVAGDAKTISEGNKENLIEKIKEIYPDHTLTFDEYNYGDELNIKSFTATTSDGKSDTYGMPTKDDSPTLQKRKYQKIFNYLKNSPVYPQEEMVYQFDTPDEFNGRGYYNLKVTNGAKAGEEIDINKLYDTYKEKLPKGKTEESYTFGKWLSEQPQKYIPVKGEPPAEEENPAEEFWKGKMEKKDNGE
jgi:hypothetical protein